MSCRERGGPEEATTPVEAHARLRAGRGRPHLARFASGGATGATRRIALPVRSTSCAVARRFVRATLVGERWPGDIDAAVLLASELVANAVRHAGSPCYLSLRVERSRLRVEAVDAEPCLPAVQPPSPERLEGRGLFLVDELASAWGSWAVPEQGKTIWFELAAASDGGR